MPRNIVDLSAVSPIIRDEPWHLHFWELTPTEFAEQLRNPRTFLKSLGIELPDTCTIMSDVVNHDWIAKHTDDLTKDNGTQVCNVGGGDVVVGVYRITSYGHPKSDVGKHPKKLLHSPTEPKVPGS